MQENTKIIDQLIAKGVRVDVVEPSLAEDKGLVSVRGNISFLNGEETLVRRPYDPPYAAVVFDAMSPTNELVFAFGGNAAEALYNLEAKLARTMREGASLRVKGAVDEYVTLDAKGTVCSWGEYWKTRQGKQPTVRSNTSFNPS